MAEDHSVKSARRCQKPEEISREDTSGGGTVMEAEDAKAVDDFTCLQDVGGSGADTSQLHAATPDLKEVVTQEPSSQRHRDAPPEEFKASQPNQQGGGSDCFDATQYAFFGGNVSTEVELGGLDDEDDGAFDAPEDEEDAEALEGDMPLPQPPFGASDSASTIDALASDLKKLGSDLWGPPSQLDDAANSEGTSGGRESVASSLPSLSPWLPSGDPWRNSPPPPARGGSEGPWGGSLLPSQQQQQQQQQQSAYPPVGDHFVDYNLAFSKQQGGQPGIAEQQQQQQQQQEQQQQQWEETRMRPDSQHSLWTQQEAEQLKQQQQQQQLRAGVALSSGPQRAVREIELQQLEASLLLQQANRGEGNYAAQVAARMGGMGAYAGGAFLNPNQYMQPVPGAAQAGHWPSVAGMQNALLQAAVHTQARAGFLPPPQLMQRGGNGGGVPRGYLNPMEESLEAQRYEMQRNARYNAGRQHPMRSKYMSAEEVDNIARLQYAATHTTEPYYEDYYHQAVQAKQSAGMGTAHGRRHFAPSHLRDPTQHGRAAQPHAFVPVEGLGRLPISSIRRPRPLLEVPVGADGSHMRLEQEPMLAARIAIEDGNSVLLDVEDIDRIIMATHHGPEQEQSLHLRRQLLLEEVASSLQLADPMVPGSGMQHLHQASGRRPPAGSPHTDLVFLRLVSLPKGRKLLSRYVRLLLPGSELQRVVVMAVFRHLRFLFANVQADVGVLAQAVCLAVGGLSLTGLTLCLTAVAVAAEQPPLRFGGGGSDGASMVLRALLDRATVARTDPGALPQQHGAWQAAFDAFFQRLSKVLLFDNILESLPLPATTAAAVSKEMPLELLRAALPHTSVAQREQVGQLLQGLLRTA